MYRVSLEALKTYTRAWTLIPLHRWDATRGRLVQLGKRPLDFSWTTKEYDSRSTIARCAKENINAGVRLKSDQLVIDVDPRNGGTEGFANLCLDLGIDPAALPLVITGSGGLHHYISKPGDVPILDTLESYPGVEFKSKGRQVVAAGSIHPETKEHYRFSDSHPSLSDLPPCPRKLLHLIRRPQRSAISGGGQYTQEQIARALEKLDVTEFQDHDKWLRLMMACHHASDGDGRSEWIEWSTSDPKYAADAEIIGRRWDSLHAEKNDGITYRTLNKILADAGAANAQTAGDATGDFDAISDDDGEHRCEGFQDEEDFEAQSEDWLERSTPDDGVKSENVGGYNDETLQALERMNSKYVMCVEGSKLRVVFKAEDPILKRDYWVRMTPQDYMLLHSNHRVQRDTTGMSKNAAETMPLGKAWIEWPGRKNVEGVLFDPSSERPNFLNLWTGFANEPSREGDWSRLNELIFEVLSDGKQPIYDYILNWLRFMMQYPERRAEVALVFQGGMGVGKGTLGNVMARLIGRHAIAIASPELITGRFNSHLQDVIFLFADEAIKPYDRQAESRLKAFITEPLLAFEGKGRDAIIGTNYLHIMMASNESWVIPAGMDERRFLVSHANTSWQRRFDKWEALHNQLEAKKGSGYRRFLFDLLKGELPPKWHPRDLPSTDALLDQKIRSMSPLRQFFFNALTEKNLPFEYTRGPWEEERVRVFQEDFRQVFHAWCRDNRINPGAMGRGNTRFLMQELRQIFPSCRIELRDPVKDRPDIVPSKSDGRAQAIEIPSLAECREEFERQLGGSLNWSGDVTDWLG